MHLIPASHSVAQKNSTLTGFSLICNTSYKDFRLITDVNRIAVTV